MKELVYPRLLLPQAERFADKIGFIDTTRAGLRYEGTFGSHVERVQRLSHALDKQLALLRHQRLAALAMNATSLSSCTTGFVWGAPSTP